MSRKLIIDGNAVYEIDENCMMKRKVEGEEEEKEKENYARYREVYKENKKRTE